MENPWEVLAAAIISTSADMRAQAPDSDTATEGEAYVARVLTACLSDALLGHLLNEDGFSRALPTRGAPNPDYLMRHAGLDPEKRYCVAGNLRDSERVGIGLYRVGSGGVEIAEYAVIDNTNTAEDGSFSLCIAADASGPASLKLASDTPILLARILHRQPAAVPATLRLQGATPVRNLALAGGDLNSAVTRSLHMTQAAVRQYLQWSAVASRYPNRLVANVEGLEQSMQGDPDTRYLLGYFALAEGESLEVTMPGGHDGYWSLHAYNHWCEYLPGASADDRTTTAGVDGSMVINLGPDVPAGVANRVDTCGRRRGVLVGRVIGADLTAPVTCRVIGVNDR